MSEILDMMRDVPSPLAAAWGGWLVVGLLLLLWQLRAHPWEQEHQRLIRAAARVRTKSGVRPSSGVRKAVKPPPPADAFGELEALLEPAPTNGALSRRPGD